MIDDAKEKETDTFTKSIDYSSVPYGVRGVRTFDYSTVPD